MNIPVIDEELDARKHGLRIKVMDLETDDDGYIIQMSLWYTGYRQEGGFILEASKDNRIKLEIE